MTQCWALSLLKVCCIEQYFYLSLEAHLHAFWERL